MYNCCSCQSFSSQTANFGASAPWVMAFKDFHSEQTTKTWLRHLTISGDRACTESEIDRNWSKCRCGFIWQMSAHVYSLLNLGCLAIFDLLRVSCVQELRGSCRYIAKRYVCPAGTKYAYCTMPLEAPLAVRLNFGNLLPKGKDIKIDTKI